MINLTRRNIRYWCFRFKTEKLGGNAAVNSPEGLKKHFENLEWFDSWLNFGVTWDVRDDDPLILTKLKRSHDDSWADVLKTETKVLVLENTSTSNTPDTITEPIKTKNKKESNKKK